MYTAGNNPEAVYCIGKISEYISLLNSCRNYDAKQNAVYLYYEEQLSMPQGSGKNILLLNTDIHNIAFCIKNDVGSLFFFHNNYVISESDISLLNTLESKYLVNKSYLLLKQLNLIKLVFDIRKKSVVLSSLPTHVQMEHTTFCNARCIMCDHYIARNRGAKHLKLSTVECLESLLPYVSLVIMHGNGEPLLNPDILPIFDLYKKYQIRTSLNTNLSYLSDDILSSIRDNCENIHVSCDGSNEMQYESIRQGLSYSEFISNVQRLAAVCSSTEKVLEVVLMRQNIRNTKTFVQFAYDYGFKKVIFNALGCNEWIGNMKDGLYNCLSSAIYYCRIAKEEGDRLGVNVITPFEYLEDYESGIDSLGCLITEDYPSPEYSQALHEKYPWYTNTIAVDKLTKQSITEYDKSKIITGICEYPFAKTYIDLSGNVSFCCPASRKFVDTLSYDKNFKYIWNNDMYQGIRRTFYSKRMPLLCKDCYLVKNRTLNFLDCCKLTGGK